MTLSYIDMRASIKKVGKPSTDNFLLLFKDIEPDYSSNPRMDYGDLTRLDSLKDYQIEPLQGYMNEDGKFVPKGGHSRCKWFEMQDEEFLATRYIECKLIYDTSSDIGALDLIVNSSSAKVLSLLEQGVAYKRYRDDHNLTVSEIAKRISKTSAHIGACLLLVDNTSEEVLTCVENGDISASEVIKLNQKLEPEEVETLVLEAVDLAKEQGKKATAKTIKQVREKKDPKPKVEDVESQFCEDGDEYAEHKAIADFLAMLSKEDWEELDLGPLRKIISYING